MRRSFKRLVFIKQCDYVIKNCLTEEKFNENFSLGKHEIRSNFVPLEKFCLSGRKIINNENDRMTTGMTVWTGSIFITTQTCGCLVNMIIKLRFCRRKSFGQTE